MSAVDAMRHRWARLASRWQASTSTRPWIGRVIGFIVLAGGVLFVARALQGQRGELTAAAIAIPPWAYGVLLVLATMTVLVTATIHAAVLANMTLQPLDPARVRYAYAASQLARYVPGKVFGVLLEAQMLPTAVGLGRVVAATLMQTLLMYAWAAGLAAAILAAVSLHSIWPVFLAPATLLVIWIAERNEWLEWLGRAWPRITPWIPTLPPDRRASAGHASRIVGLLALQWIPFFAVWALLSGDASTPTTALWLGASYLLASISGSLVVVIPSGVVVREAIFVWLGSLHGLNAADLTAWAVVVRFVLTLADVCAVPLLWGFARRSARR